jgi:hypothetical protein
LQPVVDVNPKADGLQTRSTSSGHKPARHNARNVEAPFGFNEFAAEIAGARGHVGRL